MLKSLSMLSMLTSSGDKYALASVPIILSLLQNHNGKVGELYGRNLRELVVALSLDSSHFSRNMRTINQQIKEAESTFHLAGTGVENYEKTIAGTEAKLSMLGNKLTRQQRAVEQYSRALVAANEKLRENYDRHQDYSQRLEQTKARQEDLRFEVEAATVAYEGYRDSLGETDSVTIAAKQNLERYQEEYAEATAEVNKLEGQVKALQKTMQNSADAVSKAQTDLNNAKAAVKDTEAEIRRLTEQLYRMQSAWTQAGEALTAISKKCETISKAMTKAGKTLTTNITTPIVLWLSARQRARFHPAGCCRRKSAQILPDHRAFERSPQDKRRHPARFRRLRRNRAFSDCRR